VSQKEANVDTKSIYLQLRAEAAELDRQVVSLTQRQGALRKLLEGLREYDPSLTDADADAPSARAPAVLPGPGTSRIRERRRRSSPARDVVLAALDESPGRFLTTDQVVALVTERGEDMDKTSVRKVLSRAIDEGDVLSRPLNGRSNLYASAKTTRVIGVTHPENSEAPASDAGASVSESPSEGDSQQEGGTGDAGADLRHHDHDPVGPGWNDRGDDRGASIGGAN